MKNLLLSVAIMAMMAGPASAGLKLPCGPAVGNWVNASPITCPFDSGNGLKKHVSRLKSAPPLIDEEDEEGDGGGEELATVY
jgi:hypothetical protein